MTVEEEWRIRYNNEYQLYDNADISTVIKLRKLKWTGHVTRMHDSAIPKKTLIGSINGKRPAGRPRDRWEDSVRRDCGDFLGLIAGIGDTVY